jgi:hypothetical protein
MPTPEGVHRDRSRFVGIHLIARRNVRGGYTRIYGKEDNHESAVACLTDPADSIVSDDTRLRHLVTPIKPLNPRVPGVRDMLILTYDLANGRKFNVVSAMKQKK